MLFDTLTHALNEIDYYLNNPTYASIYTGELRDRVMRLRNDMNQIRIDLDTPPVITYKGMVLFNTEYEIETMRYMLKVGYPKERVLDLTQKHLVKLNVLPDDTDGKVRAIALTQAFIQELQS
jgi:hypothetical protein